MSPKKMRIVTRQAKVASGDPAGTSNASIRVNATVTAGAAEEGLAPTLLCSVALSEDKTTLLISHRLIGYLDMGRAAVGTAANTMCGRSWREAQSLETIDKDEF
jgi:hypothetical protein